MKFPVFQRLQWESGRLQRLKGLVGRKLSRVCLLKVEEHGTCCLVKMLKSRRMSWSDWPAGNWTHILTKRGPGGLWLHEWLCLVRGEALQLILTKVAQVLEVLLRAAPCCEKMLLSLFCRLREGNVHHEEHFAGDFGAYGRSLHCTLFFSRHLTLL